MRGYAPSTLEHEVAEVRNVGWQIIVEISDQLESIVGPVNDSETPEATLRLLILHVDTISRGIDNAISDDNLEAATVLSRSALEALTKFLFISLQETRAEREEATSEFWTHLLGISSFRFHERAKAASEFSKLHRDDFSAIVFARAAESVSEERHKLTKAERTRIEQRWAFTKICEWARPRLDEIHLGSIFDLLVFDYGTASHIAHADGIGLRLLLDDLQRPEEERSIKAIATASSLYTSVVTCWLLMWLAAARMQRSKPSNSETIRSRYAQFVSLTALHQERFAASQAEFYSQSE